MSGGTTTVETGDVARVIAEQSKKIFKGYELAARFVRSPARKKKILELGRAVVRRAERRAEKKRREGGDARKVAYAMRHVGLLNPPPKVRLPSAEKFCADLRREISFMFWPGDKRWDKVNEVIKFRADVDRDVLESLAAAMGGLAKRIDWLAGRLLAEPDCKEGQGQAMVGTENR
jgi:hypothetical protein